MSKTITRYEFINTGYAIEKLLLYKTILTHNSKHNIKKSIKEKGRYDFYLLGVKSSLIDYDKFINNEI